MWRYNCDRLVQAKTNEFSLLATLYRALKRDETRFSLYQPCFVPTQLVEIPAVPSSIPVHHDGASDEHHGEGSEGRGLDQRFWQLRLLLSLEEKERTRTRLIVTEVVTSTIAEIIDLIPGRVRSGPLQVYLVTFLHRCAISCLLASNTSAGYCR